MWPIFDVRQKKVDATKATKTAMAVLKCVAVQDFDGLLKVAPRSRLSAAEIKKVVADYGRRPVLPGRPIEELMGVVEVRDSRPKSWSVNLPLWTEEEGRSDLTLEMRFTDSDTDTYSIEIEDLHVL